MRFKIESLILWCFRTVAVHIPNENAILAVILPYLDLTMAMARRQTMRSKEIRDLYKAGQKYFQSIYVPSSKPVILKNLDLEGINFQGSAFDFGKFTESKLENANFTNTHLESASFNRANLKNANFQGAYLGHCRF